MGLFDGYRNRRDERRLRQDSSRAACLYQITEYDGELWLTFADNLVCPCSMLNEKPVDAVRQMRELYIKRNRK